jgi:hypothetical protein
MREIFELILDMTKALVGPFILWVIAMTGQVESFQSNKVVRAVELKRSKKILRAIARPLKGLDSLKAVRTFREKVARERVTVLITKRRLARMVMCLSLLVLAGQAVDVYLQREEARKLTEELIAAAGEAYNEASGGAAVDDYAYLVDDDSAVVYKLVLKNPGRDSDSGQIDFDEEAYKNAEVLYASAGTISLSSGDGPQLSGLDVREPDKLLDKLRGDGPEVTRIREMLSAETQKALEEDRKRAKAEKEAEEKEKKRVARGEPQQADGWCAGLKRPPRKLRSDVLRELNALIAGGGLSRPELQAIFPDEIGGGRRVLDKEDADDFEAIAYYDRMFYLITSHSNTVKGNYRSARERLLAIPEPPKGDGGGELRAEVNRYATDLREAIIRAIDEFYGARGPGFVPYRNREHRCEVMQIEGLAIKEEVDERGVKEPFAFIGLRAPVSKEEDGSSAAFVLQAPLASLFTDEPKFKVFRLNFQQKEKAYGITSLDWDARSGKMLIVGGPINNTDDNPSILCEWLRFDKRAVGEVQQTDCKPFPNPEGRGGVTKLELLLLPPMDLIFTFRDTDNRGAGKQLIYKRSKLKLTSPQEMR